MTLTSSIPVLRVADYPAARAFWRDILGFKVMEEAGDPITGFGIYRRDDARVFLIAWNGPEAEYAHWRAYFHTNNLDDITAALDAAGAAYKGPTTTEYSMREVEVTDPSGNCVCFGTDA